MLTCCQLTIKDTLHETQEDFFFFNFETISTNVMYTINTGKQCNEFESSKEKENFEQVQIEKEIEQIVIRFLMMLMVFSSIFLCS